MVTKDVYELVMGGIKFEKSYANINKFLVKDKAKVFTIGNFIQMEQKSSSDERLDRILGAMRFMFGSHIICRREKL